MDDRQAEVLAINKQRGEERLGKKPEKNNSIASSSTTFNYFKQRIYSFAAALLRDATLLYTLNV